MPRIKQILSLALVSCLTCSLASAEETPAEKAEAVAPVLSADEADRLFTLKVLPVFKDKCLGCHGHGDELKGEFDARDLEGFLAGGESGEPGVVPGEAAESIVYQAVMWDGYEMPPKENDRLTAEQCEAVRQWIEAGVHWPDAETQQAIEQREWSIPENEDGLLVATSGGLSDQWTYRRYQRADIWAFQPIADVQIPDSPALTDDPSNNPIDAFIAEKLQSSNVRPAPLAAPRTLIRRATYDLTGLPPTPEEITQFESAWAVDSNEAWSSLIDRLLDSPQYGEHWGQHWLDIVRYADTSGFSNDWERSNAWRYRDYVIRSIGADKPYNEFALEQLAGDEIAALKTAEQPMPDWIPQSVIERSESELLIASGFLRMGPWEHTPMSPDKVSRQQYIDDVVNGVGQTFMSTAMRCAKCHDHKFDPMPTKDYYRMYAAFSATQLAERPADFLEIENRSAFADQQKHVETLLAESRKLQDALYDKREQAARQWYAERGRADDYVPNNERMRLPEGDKPPRHYGLTVEDEGALKIYEQNVRIWTRRLERFEPLAQSVYNGGDLFQKSQKLRLPNPNNKQEAAKLAELPVSHILSGGSIFAEADLVTPGVLSSLPIESPVGTALDAYRLPDTADGRRLAFAQWIINPKNPLSTRSITNRIWKYHFGSGIAGNPNNFGATGKKPTHPELLDWLTTRFVDDGWSMKKMHRLVMTSDVYMRSSGHPDVAEISQIDPDNDLLAYYPPRRLTAEELRDSMLAISGELNYEQGGLPIMPEINMEVALEPRMLQFSIAPAWQPSPTPDQRNRRSIYAYQVRGLPDPLMEVFNKPTSAESCELRDESSVTPQVFTLLNGDIVTKRSIAMAARLAGESNQPADQIARAYELTNGHAAPNEIQSALETHYRSMVSYHRAHKPADMEYPTAVERSVVEEFSGETVAYTERLNAYEDYVPDQDAADVTAEVRALADICLLLFNSNGFMYVY